MDLKCLRRTMDLKCRTQAAVALMCIFSGLIPPLLMLSSVGIVPYLVGASVAGDYASDTIDKLKVLRISTTQVSAYALIPIACPGLLL